MKLFFDTEFTGLHKNTTLISIGIVDEDDRTFYAELNDYDESQVTPWIRENVINKMVYYNRNKFDTMFVKGRTTSVYGSHEYVRDALIEWLSVYDDVQFVSDVCHYDFVLLIDLISTTGSVFDIPPQICPSCHDINQDIAAARGISEREAFDVSRVDMAGSNPHDQHNAGFDAVAIKHIYQNILRLN